MTITEAQPKHETYQPAPVKKRRVASLITAGVAGVAGLALAAAFGYISQEGSARYDGESTTPPTPVVDKVSATSLNLGTIFWSGAAYDDAAKTTAANAAPPNSDLKTFRPANATQSFFTITNENTAERKVVRLINVLQDGPDDSLYGDIWVHIERQNTWGDTRPPEFKYFGPLSELRNVYMGNIVQGATHTFEVWAWTAEGQSNATGPYDSAFTVNYTFGPDDLENAYEEIPAP